MHWVMLIESIYGWYDFLHFVDIGELSEEEPQELELESDENSSLDNNDGDGVDESEGGESDEDKDDDDDEEMSDDGDISGDEEEEDELIGQDQGEMQSFSAEKLEDEVEKGKAAKNQLRECTFSTLYITPIH